MTVLLWRSTSSFYGFAVGAKPRAHFFHACATTALNTVFTTHPMEKKLFFDDASPLPGRRGLPEEPTPAPFSASASDFSKTGGALQSFFVVRLTKSERKIIENLSKDFGDSYVEILNKSVRLYRAIAEAADQGGSLVMLTEKHTATEFLQQDKEVSILLSVLPKPRIDKSTSNHRRENAPIDTGIKNTLDTNAEATNLITHDEAIIAVRDQFADNDLTPIRINDLYISPHKGRKTERVTLKTDERFAQKLSELTEKTGLNRSVIIRDGAMLYNFVKRKFHEAGISFYIGSTPIIAI